MKLVSAAMLIALTALSSCVGGGSGPVGPVVMQPDASLDTLLNNYRSGRGLARLSRDPRLNAAAAAHARDLAAHNRLSHTGSDGSDHTARAERFGWGPFVAENVAAGQHSPAAVMQAWVGSSGHRRNIELGSATHYGFAHATSPGTQYKDFWVLVVGHPAPVPKPAPAPVAAATGPASTGSLFDFRIGGR